VNNSCTCPNCGKSLFWRGLRVGGHDLTGKRWYQYVGRNTYCPFCGTGLKNRLAYRWWKKIGIYLLVFLYLLFLQPLVSELFGDYSWKRMAIAVGYVILLFLLDSLMKCRLGFQIVKYEHDDGLDDFELLIRQSRPIGKRHKRGKRRYQR
jgi:hypothetical protein